MRAHFSLQLALIFLACGPAFASKVRGVGGSKGIGKSVSRREQDSPRHLSPESPPQSPSSTQSSPHSPQMMAASAPRLPLSRQASQGSVNSVDSDGFAAVPADTPHAVRDGPPDMSPLADPVRSRNFCDSWPGAEATFAGLEALDTRHDEEGRRKGGVRNKGRDHSTLERDFEVDFARQKFTVRLHVHGPPHVFTPPNDEASFEQMMAMIKGVFPGNTREHLAARRAIMLAANQGLWAELIKHVVHHDGVMLNHNSDPRGDLPAIEYGIDLSDPRTGVIVTGRAGFHASSFDHPETIANPLCQIIVEVKVVIKKANDKNPDAQGSIEVNWSRALRRQ